MAERGLSGLRKDFDTNWLRYGKPLKYLGLYHLCGMVFWGSCKGHGEACGKRTPYSPDGRCVSGKFF